MINWINFKPRSLLGLAVALPISGMIHAEAPTLEEVFVTAQKREQSLQDVPLSVSAVTGEMINNYRLQSIEDIQMMVPSLNIYESASPAQSSISIRGAGTGPADPTLEPSVGVFIDGVFMPRSIFGLSDLVDVERVEVLLGPQGTLYGKNTNAGVISVHSRKPTKEFKADIDVSIGNYDLIDTKLSLSGPISEGLSYRFSARNHHREGVLERQPSGEDLNQIDKQSYRGQLLWDGVENLSVHAIAYYSIADGRTNSADGFTDSNSTYGMLLAGAIIPNFSSPLNIDDNDRKVYQNELARSELETQGGSFRIDYEFNDYIFTSITGYQDWHQVAERDAGQSLLYTLELRNELEESTLSQELRLTSNTDSPLEWITGFFYFDSDLSRGSLEHDKPYAKFGDGFEGTPFALVMVPDSQANWLSKFKTRSMSLFGQASYDISENLKITAGLRYSDEDKSFNVNTITEGGGLIAAMFGGVDQNDSLSEDSLTGMLSMSYFFENAMAYATVATGEKSGGFNAAFSSVPVEDRRYDPEQTVNYEVGIKTDGLFNGLARLNLAYFFTDYNDFQTTTWNPDVSAFLVGNAKEQTTKGVELDGTLIITRGLLLSARVQYLDARYRDHKNATCHPEANAPHGPTGCDLSGKRMNYSPYWSGSLSLDYSRELFAGEIYGHALLSFRSDHVADDIFAPYAEGVSYETLDLVLGWQNGQWDISVWGKNITNETYATAYSGNVVDLLTATSTMYILNIRI